MLRYHLKKNQNLVALVNKVRLYLSYFKKNIDFLYMILIQSRYKKVIIRKKRKLLDKKLIKVAFFVTQKQLWAGQSLFDEFLCNDCFDPMIVVFPDNEDKINSNIFTTNANYDFFKNLGMSVLKGYDTDSNSYLASKNINFDIIFYDQPFPQIHNSLLWNKLSKDSLVCYIPYGFKIAAFYQSHFNMPLQNCCWRVFAESEWHKKQFIYYGAFKGRNVITSGLPRLDEYNKSSYIQNRSYKRIIWAPHWSIGSHEKEFHSTFDQNYKFFLDYAYANPEIHWVFKPHQRLKHYIVEIGLMNEEEVNHYYDEWNNLPNTFFYNDPEYFDIFKDSDALITDCGSFLAEYLPTKKPILHLVKSNKFSYNLIGEKLVKSYYKGTDHNSINTFIHDVVVNEDDFLRDSRLLNLALVQPNPKGAGKFIVDYIHTELKKDNLGG